MARVRILSGKNECSGTHRLSCAPAGWQRHGGADAGLRCGGHSAAGGQTLVEFALVLLVFMLLTVGLLDGLRVIFYYSQSQEAAREGARWGAVQVARAAPDGTTPWGTFNTPGNAAGTYTSCHRVSGCTYTAPGGSASSIAFPSNTVINAVTVATTAVDLRQATITISTTIPTTATEVTPTDALLTNQRVTVTVHYPFKPILGMVFGGVTIPLQGSSSMLHE
jgi:hypothetical protein